MPSKKRSQIIENAIGKLNLRTPTTNAPRHDAIDQAGRTYHIKYRTEGKLDSLSFDFLPEELTANYDFFVGVFVNQAGTITKAFQVRRSVLLSMVNENEDSLRLRWNDENRNDPRIKLLIP